LEELLPPLRQAGREVIVGFVGFLQDAVDFMRPSFQYLATGTQMLGEVFRTGIEVGRSLWETGKTVWTAFKMILEPFGLLLGEVDLVRGVFTAVIMPIQLFAATVQAGAITMQEAFENIRYAVNHPTDNPLGRAASLQWFREQVGLTNAPSGSGAPGFSSFIDNFNQAMARMRGGPAGAPQGPQTYAAQQARYVGIEDVGREARLRAFSGGGEDPAQQTATNTAQIVQLLAQLNQTNNVGNAAIINVLTQVLQQNGPEM
jgi:hypothetical protein